MCGDNLLTIVKSKFYDIPEHMEEDLLEEIQNVYKAISYATIPVLDEIVQQLTYFVLLLAHETSQVEEILYESTDFLKTFLGDDAFFEHYMHLRENVDYYLRTHNYFYEDNWLYAPCILDYNQGFINSPLQDVW